MKSKAEKLAAIAAQASAKGRPPALSVTIMSFGYKEGAPPLANLVFDVRFLKNPYWVEELRPLTGLDPAVQDYVLGQMLANEFLDSVMAMLEKLLPRLIELQIGDFAIAFGCTGGQHRSATLAEALGNRLQERFPEITINRQHRELSERDAKQACEAMAED
jgi:UPF0042 nucleotide-binding protein